LWSSAGGAYVSSPNQNQYTSTHLNDLISNDSQYIQQARTNAMNQAASRGLGNSAYAAGNAQAAAINAALPIAQADAGVDFNTAQANQAALNQVLMANNQNATSSAVAAASAGAAERSAEWAYKASVYGANQQMARQTAQNSFNAGQADIDRQYNQSMLGLQNYYNQQNMGLQNQYAQQNWANNLYGSILQGAYGTMYSNPDYFSDPNAALGFIQVLVTSARIRSASTCTATLAMEVANCVGLR
jgi:hypothetical protein